MSDLAQILGVNRAFITRMKKSGFRMPGGRASIAAAHRFMDGAEVIVPAPVSRNRRDEGRSQAVA